MRQEQRSIMNFVNLPDSAIKVREGFKNQINYFRGIFREWGGEVPPIRENNQFYVFCAVFSSMKLLLLQHSALC